MRPIWQGAVSFGLVSIPVKVFPAVQDKDIKFRFLHKECHTPLKYERMCPTCERAVPMEEVERASCLSHLNVTPNFYTQIAGHGSFAEKRCK
ncbi:MAG: Ku protein [Syntrophaceticus sp.]